MKRAVNQSTALSFRWTLRPWQESLLIAKSATLSVWRHFSLEDACPADRVDMATIQTIAPSGWTWKISKNFIHFWKLRSSKSLQFDLLELWFNWIEFSLIGSRFHGRDDQRRGHRIGRVDPASADRKSADRLHLGPEPSARAQRLQHEQLSVLPLPSGQNRL